MGRTAETMVRVAQQSAYTTMDYAVKAQEINAELLRKTVEIWIEGIRKQADLTEQMSQEVFEKAEDQAHASQDFFGQWGFPVWWTPYDPFTFWREWTQAVQKTVSDVQKTANVNRNNRSPRR